jgi:hypothetical protein
MRFYRVKCRTATGKERMAWVAIGPRHAFDFDLYDTLTWRLAETTKRKRRIRESSEPD